MKKTRILTVALLGIAAAATLTCAEPIAQLFQSQTDIQEVQWRTDLNEAHKESVSQNLPLLIVFDADWCAYCRKMEAGTLSDTSVVSYVNDRFIPVHLNLEDNSRIAEVLEVDRIPCTIALSPRADLLGRVVGYVNTVQYCETLARVRALQSRIDRRSAAATN